MIHGSILLRSKKYISPKWPDQLWGSIHAVAEWVTECSPEVKLWGHGVEHSPPFSVEIKKECNYAFIPPYAFMACTGTTLLCASMDLQLLESRVLSVCVEANSLVPDIVSAGVTSRSRIILSVFIWQYNNVTTLNWCRIPSMGNFWLWNTIGLTAGCV